MDVVANRRWRAGFVLISSAHRSPRRVELRSIVAFPFNGMGVLSRSVSGRTRRRSIGVMDAIDRSGRRLPH